MNTLAQRNGRETGNRTADLSPTPCARFIGIDAGAETIKLVELLRDENGVRENKGGRNPSRFGYCNPEIIDDMRKRKIDDRLVKPAQECADNNC